MPGMWGAVGYSPLLCAVLRAKFEEPWVACDATTVAGGMLGGHAFPPYSSLHVQPDGAAFAVDGEASAYSVLEKRTGQSNAIWELDSGQLSLSAKFKGNLALADSHSRLWFLATEWSGIFPLYYLVTDTGLAFCSRQRPIAEVFGLALDPLGLLEFLRYGYTLAGRTMFRDLRRLLPGQVLTCDPLTKKVDLRDTSEAWASEPAPRLRLDEVADRCWRALSEGVKGSMPDDLRHAVMISGGWDSRTLLAAAAQHVPSTRLLGYSHGDLASRELRIAGRVCQSLSVPFRAEPIDDATFDLEPLQRGFARTENVTFPHWHRAGALLSELGVDSVSAGVYGEVLGGHYGAAMLLHGAAKVMAVGRLALGFPARRDRTTGPVEAVRDLFRVREVVKNWYLTEDFWDSIDHPADALNADIERELRRLVVRGVVEPDKLVEAFISENRGTQYISAQILSCRAHLNIAVPFVDRDLLLTASRLPIGVKIHNSVNRRMMQRHAAALLRFPCAATLLPASMPILFLEASRLVRYIVAGVQWKIHVMTKGMVGAPRLSWVNFEFLRSGKCLLAIAEELRSPIWDRRAMSDRIDSLAHTTRVEPSNYAHALANQFMIISTADLITR
jgi:hypothetical protein